MPFSPVVIAPRMSPAPRWRPTEAVVPYARKMHSPTNVCSTVDAIARPASGVVPRWPTMAVSASSISGSETSAANAGTAIRRISRSSRFRRGRSGGIGAILPDRVRVGSGRLRVSGDPAAAGMVDGPATVPRAREVAGAASGVVRVKT